MYLLFRSPYFRRLCSILACRTHCSKVWCLFSILLSDLFHFFNSVSLALCAYLFYYFISTENLETGHIYIFIFLSSGLLCLCHICFLGCFMLSSLFNERVILFSTLGSCSVCVRAAVGAVHASCGLLSQSSLWNHFQASPSICYSLSYCGCNFHVESPAPHYGS